MNKHQTYKTSDALVGPSAGKYIKVVGNKRYEIIATFVLGGKK